MVSLTIFPEQNQDILSTQQSCQTGAVAVGVSSICDIWHLFSLFLSYLTILMIMLARKGDFRKDEIST